MARTDLPNTTATQRAPCNAWEPSPVRLRWAFWWWFTSWYLLHGAVRWRVLLPTGLVTSVATSAYGLSAAFWMPGVVTRNAEQFGFFGVALALVTWFSGAAICILIGACAGPVLAEDAGGVGTLIRGPHPSFLTNGASRSLPPPDHELRFRDAFTQSGET